MTEEPHDRAQFHAAVDGTQDDWMKIAAASVAFNRATCPPRAGWHLKMLDGD